MLPDPLSVSYDGVSRSLPRVSSADGRTVYRTSDRELEVVVLHSPTADGRERHSVKMTRHMPDATPLDVFDAYRDVANSVELVFVIDPNRKDIDAIADLRTALLALADSAFQGRVLGGEG